MYFTRIGLFINMVILALAILDFVIKYRWLQNESKPFCNLKIWNSMSTYNVIIFVDVVVFGLLAILASFQTLDFKIELVTLQGTPYLAYLFQEYYILTPIFQKYFWMSDVSWVFIFLRNISWPNEGAYRKQSKRVKM